jgi:hypothetical protein
VFTPAANKVVVLASCNACGAAGDYTYRFISAATNGASFAAPVDVGDIDLNGQAAFINTGDVGLGVSGRRFQGMDDTAGMVFNLGETPSSVYDASVVTGPGASEAVYAVNDLDIVRYRVFNDGDGGTVDALDLSNQTYWGGAGGTKLLPGAEGNNDETRLGSGPSGIFLTYRYGQPTENRIGLRRFDGATETFGAPSYIEGDDAIENNGIGESSHSQDASGRLHVVWRSLYDGNRLRYRRSEDAGATFTPAANLATRETFQSPMVAAGPTGSGFAVWRGSGDAVRVVVIDPQAEPAAPGGPGGPGGPDTTRPTAGGFSAGDTTLTPGAGTTFTFTSSEAGVATLTVQKQVPGLKVRQRGRTRCVPATRRRLRALRRRAGSQAAFRRLLRQRRCKAYKRIGRIQQAVTPGRNTIVFNGRIAGRRLRPGRYRALLVIRDSAGNVSRTEQVRFRVLRRRR